MCHGFVYAPVIETSLELSDDTPGQELHKYICKISLDNNLRSFQFMKYLVVPQNWFGIFMIFLWFWRILQYLCFYRKREKWKKKKNACIRKKACIGLVQPQRSRPNCKDSTQVEKLHKYICMISLDNNMWSFRFLIYLVAPQNCYGIFMIFLWFWRCKDST